MAASKELSREYRQFAEECLRLAREANDEPRRQLFIEMASAWVQEAALADGTLPIGANADPSAAPKQ